MLYFCENQVCRGLARSLTISKCKFNLLAISGLRRGQQLSHRICDHPPAHQELMFPLFWGEQILCCLSSPLFNDPFLVNLHPAVPEIQESCLSSESPNHQYGSFSVSYFLDEWIFNYFKTAKAPEGKVPIANNTTAAGWYMLPKDRTPQDLFQDQLPC